LPSGISDDRPSLLLFALLVLVLSPVFEWELEYHIENLQET
jgi:hypothetical protein